MRVSWLTVVAVIAVVRYLAVSKLLTRKSGKHYWFHKQEFWAETGLVRIRDHRNDPPDVNTVSRREFLLRAKAINDQLKDWPWNDERRHMERFVQDAIACCEEAFRQGDPSHAGTWRHLAAQRRSSGRYLYMGGKPATNVVPGPVNLGGAVLLDHVRPLPTSSSNTIQVAPGRGD